MRKYFFTDGKNKHGPFSKDELKNQNITRNTKIWFYGLEQWTELSKVPELNDVITAIPPKIKTRNIPPKQIESKINEGSSQKPEKNKPGKSRNWVFGIFAIIIVSIIGYFSFRNQADVNLYNEIVSSSYQSNQNFDMYVEKFYRDLEYFGIYPQKPKKTIIKYARLDQLDKTTHIHALSFGIYDDEKIEIYINPSTWENFNKPMRYFLMYHELAHDVLDLDDLDQIPANEGKLMYPAISTYENKNMDDFIESSHALFEKISTD